MTQPDHAIVLFSGGQDSTMALVWALERFGHLETLAVNYGQSNSIELEQRKVVREELRKMKPEWRARLGHDEVIDASRIFKGVRSSLLTHPVSVQTGIETEFVPGRNLFFLQCAVMLAAKRNAGHVVMGVFDGGADDFPDCDDKLLSHFANIVAQGMGQVIAFTSPYFGLGKPRLWHLAEQIGGSPLVELIRAETHSCYSNDRTAHAWGAGCGECNACELRRAGWEAFQCAS